MPAATAGLVVTAAASAAPPAPAMSADPVLRSELQPVAQHSSAAERNTAFICARVRCASYAPPTPSVTLPVPPQYSQSFPRSDPLPPHLGQMFSPVPGVPGGA